MQELLADAAIEMPVKKAREKVAEYLKAVRGRHTKEDEAILRGYKALARGHRVIDLPAIIRAGGIFDETSLPRLAVATSSHDFVHVERDTRGRVTFQPASRIAYNRRKDCFFLPTGTLPDADYDPNNWQWWNGRMRAMVPTVPPALRPNHSLDGYATLFEVEEWALDPTAPADPALLKHIGGDLYAILATWDLSPLEQSVLNGRVR